MIAIGADRFRSRAAASRESGAGSGGDVDDFSKRLTAVEAGIAEIRGEMRHVATKADLKAEIGSLRSAIDEKIGSLRSAIDEKIGSLRSDIDEKIGSLRSGIDERIGSLRSGIDDKIGSLRSDMELRMHAMEVRMITWIVGTMLSTSATAFAMARYFHP
jgi:hypothetical protein